jgi:uncharacterized membrane protein (Fun14 family)
MVVDLTTLPTAAGFPLMGGGLLGFATGYFLKKILKFIIIGIGAVVFLLGYLEYQRWVTENWLIIQNQTSTFMTQAAHKAYVVTSHLGHSIPIGVGLMGFVPGVFLGFLKG